MATKDQVIALNARHPDWTAGRIASELGCGSGYVRACGQRYGLKFPYASARGEERRSRRRRLVEAIEGIGPTDTLDDIRPILREIVAML